MSVTCCYCIDIDDKKLEIKEFSGKELQDDYKTYNTLDFKDLVDHDRHLFEKITEAEIFLTTYNIKKAALETIPTYRKKLKNIPKLMIYRRYLVTSLMGIKTYTTRSFNKPWMRGQIIQLCDRTYYVNVTITGIEKIIINKIVMYKYSYELCK